MFISRLFIYPIKSCAPVEVEYLAFDRFGPVGDRRFLVVDTDGRFLTQREHSDMAFLRPVITADGLRLSGCGPRSEVSPFNLVAPESNDKVTVTVWRDQMQAIDCGDEVAAWVSDFLDQPCRLVRMPDDHQRPVKGSQEYPIPEGTQVVYADGAPLLVITEESIAALSDAAGMDVDLLRFRPNIVVSEAGEAFAERGWRTLSAADGGELIMAWPCERCVVPTRDPGTQQRTPEVMTALKDLCRIDGKIIFGQNALFSGESLTVGEALLLPELPEDQL